MGFLYPMYHDKKTQIIFIFDTLVGGDYFPAEEYGGMVYGRCIMNGDNGISGTVDLKQKVSGKLDLTELKKKG